MNTIDAIIERRSTRAFLDTPIEKEKLDKIFEAAQRSPSWANTQPWEAFVASGETLERIKAGFKEKHENKAEINLETPRPKEWSDLAKRRVSEIRPSLIRICGEEAADQFAPLNQAMFNAPTVIFLCIDKVMTEWAMYDIGAYAQNIMLAAEELGLATIPAIQLLLFPDVLRKEMDIPENLKFTIGIAIGYEDKENRINDFVSERDPISNCVRFFD